ncbi:Forms aploid and binucleate cells 1c, putative isoform 4 [Hibiscus syriacus]|uniref:1-phosphatidylinositol-3-phosphate 5-kinase n=1 Tax=Hibiscus syriacus TaxID=106335 RepID=A0A6A3BRL6_HIBSY|nr:Forms aploid and binucleate cells 1c, putative isoform 4 [Hibiscus syriacus]
MMSVKSCKLCCDGVNSRLETGGRKCSEKVHPSESPRESPELISPCSMNSESIRSDHLGQYLEALSTQQSGSRSDEEDVDDSGKQSFSPSAENGQDVSDIDSSSISARNEFYSCKPVGSSPSVSPSRNSFTPYRDAHSVQQRQEGSPMVQNFGPFGLENMAVLRKPPETAIEKPENTDDYSDDASIDENDEAESNLFSYDDEDDDVGDSGAMFSSSSSLSNMFPAKEKQEGNKEPIRAVIQGHFRALVSQLLLGEGIKVEDNAGGWLDIVTALAWQAANFVKPDTSRGGSMDPGDYVKVKCIASGTPSESTLVKGVVCTKNVKHKRMTSQYKKPRLLLVGGALEFLKVPNQLASFSTLLQQENDHLKMIIEKIESLRPNVLLVEKSASSYAQEYLLAKEISLVLNVKRPLLERIARCTGALVCPSIDNLSTTQLGHCELFRLEKVSEEHEMANQFNKKPSKTLMFFEGCPRRLCCTVLLRGRSREELKKVKHVVQYALFAAYHLSLETSFLADEGATLPKMKVKPPISVPDKMEDDSTVSVAPNSYPSSTFDAVVDASPQNDISLSLNPAQGGMESLSEQHDQSHFFPSSGGSVLDSYNDDMFASAGLDMYSEQFQDSKLFTMLPCDNRNFSQSDLQETMAEEESHLGEIQELVKSEKIDDDEASSEYFSAADTHQSILVSFSSRCVLKGTVCERARPLRIKFYGSFDKPLGRYLRDDLFDQASCCRSCNEQTEAHDGKIWMWHRCLKCVHINGIPPATRRVVMSDAAWGLSFGKFLELSFSNHATANRVATCGHSLQRDCLRFYGGSIQQEWIRKEAAELMVKMEILYEEVSHVLDSIEQKIDSADCPSSDASDLQNHIMELREQMWKEINNYNGLLQPVVMETSEVGVAAVDILELNRLRRSLLIGTKCSQIPDSLEPPTNSIQSGQIPILSNTESVVPKESDLAVYNQKIEDDIQLDGSITSPASSLSAQIDSAWTGTDLLASKVQPPEAFQENELQPSLIRHTGKTNLRLSRVASPRRLCSFDSAMRFQERIQKGLHPSSTQLSMLRSFHASGDYTSMIRDPVSNVMRNYSNTLSLEAQKMNLLLSSAPTLITSASHVVEGARLLLSQRGHSDIVIAVYDNDPASIISYALSSKEYDEWVTDKSNEIGGGWSFSDKSKEDSSTSSFSPWQSFGSLDLDYIRYGSFGSEDASSSVGRKCCPSGVDFLRSLSRYSFTSGSPTCLAKVLGIYQVSVKQLKGGKETKMDVMVMENLFFRRSISTVYDLKGSIRSRYNPDTTGANKVLLDMNLLETLRTEPIFLGSKAKRNLERAIWNDTSFLASVDVMDYLTCWGGRGAQRAGFRNYRFHATIYMGQAFGDMGQGIRDTRWPEECIPNDRFTKQYKKRFRKAMTTYFLTIPDQWSS